MRVCAPLLVLVSLAACEGDRIRGTGGPSPTGDAAVVVGADAAPKDGEVRRDGGAGDATSTDGGDPGDAAAPVDAAPPADAGLVDAGGEVDAGPRDGGSVVAPGMLVADRGANQILLLDPGGAVTRTYPSPIRGVSGVALDRRARDGFWIAGAGSTNPLFTKLDWSGVVVARHDYPQDRLFQFLDEGVKSLDHHLGPTPDGDSFVFLFTNYNQVDVVAVGAANSVGFGGETGLGLQLGFFGIHANVASLSNAQALDVWTTRSGGIERWTWAGGTPAAVVPTPAAALAAVEQASDGTFWVTIPAQNAVQQLSAQGAAVGAPIVLPVMSIADLSLIE